MSRVYRVLKKAEREKQEKLQEKTSSEKPKEPEVFKKEEVPLEFSGEKRESLGLPMTEEVPLLIPPENPFAAEEFRKLKTQVFHWSPNPPHIILVTSTFPSEGKTMVSVNLAMSISTEINKEAILIDADLRKPSVLSEESGYPKGLSNYLADETPFADIVRHSKTEKLWIIPAGPPSKNSTELIGSKRMEELLKRVRIFGQAAFSIIE